MEYSKSMKNPVFAFMFFLVSCQSKTETKKTAAYQYLNGIVLENENLKAEG
jgi:hypothetical protein